MSKLSKNVLTGEDLQLKFRSGLDKLYEVAIAAYGPQAGTAAIEMPYGDPLLSRDGVTNLENLYLEDEHENIAIRTVLQASKKSNKRVGDGTSAVCVLAYHLYLEARKMVVAGHNPMEVSRLLLSTAEAANLQIDKWRSPEVTDKDLQNIASVSASDHAIGSLISDVVKDVGRYGGITTEDFRGSGIYSELMDGFYFRKGFTNPYLISDISNAESRLTDVPIIISDKKLVNQADAAPIFEKILDAGIKEVVFVGDVGDEALQFMLQNKSANVFSVTLVDLPTYGPMRTLAMDDLAVVTNARIIMAGSNSSDFDVDMIGAAKKVIVNEYSASIIGGDGAKEDVEVRIKELEGQLAEAESSVTVQVLRERLARLNGKIALIKVGGAVESEQKEVKLRVEDAIAAVQAAMSSGYVAGGGTTLARLKLEHFQEAFKQPFVQLVTNSGNSADEAYWKMMKKPYGYGYNLNDKFGEPINLLKAGIIDPTQVAKEIVTNACSVVSNLIKVRTAITHVDREVKLD